MKSSVFQCVLVWGWGASVWVRDGKQEVLNQESGDDYSTCFLLEAYEVTNMKSPRVLSLVKKF